MSFFDDPDNWAAWQEELVELRAERARRQVASNKKAPDSHKESELKKSVEAAATPKPAFTSEPETLQEQETVFVPEPEKLQAPEAAFEREPEKLQEPEAAFEREPEKLQEPETAFEREPEKLQEPEAAFEREPETLQEPEPDLPRSPRNASPPSRESITLEDLEYDAAHGITSKIETRFNSARSTHEIGIAVMREAITLEELEVIVSGRSYVKSQLAKEAPELKHQHELSGPQIGNA